MSSRPELTRDWRYEDLAYGQAVRISDFKDQLSPIEQEYLRRANENEGFTAAQITPIIQTIKGWMRLEKELPETKENLLKFLNQTLKRAAQVKVELGERRPVADVRMRVVLSTPRYEDENKTDLLIRVAEAIRRGDPKWTVDIEAMEIMDEVEL